MTDREPAVRRTAVAVLTETTSPGTGPALAAALADRDAAVRKAAIPALTRRRAAEEARAALAAATADADADVRAYAARAL
ncbi:HEAT repeat domain-containing protein [Streptomyces carpinensis]|uniref:HEAT repeat domain-containing protein n=1 Tax=Streptomyces carpinensis TaxID=66369 RepID=UPI001FC8F5AC|nr:HEAT repeat domain-containing protein [Streptomyces carpinensis]